MTIVTDDVDLERDRHLVEQCQAGRGEAFAELYAIYHDRLVRHCARRLGSHADAEDVAQEAFVRAWRAIGHFEGRRRFYPWLHVIASNACTDVLRRERPTAPLSELVGAAASDDAPGIEEVFSASIDATVAGEAMQLLNERHRRVLYLREALEWSVQDIAAHEGLEPNAIDSLLWRARASLRQKFQHLSEGVAALFATGTTGFFTLRHRMVRLAHTLHEPGRVSLPARAVVAAVIFLGAGAATAPLLSSPGTHPEQIVTVHTGTGTEAAVTNRSATTTPRTTHAPPAPSTPAAAAADVSPASAVRNAPVRVGSSAVPPATASPAGPVTAPSPGAARTAADPGTPLAPTNVVSTVTGATQKIVGTVSGVTATVANAAGGTVQTTVTDPVLTPVIRPVSRTVTGLGIPLP